MMTIDEAIAEDKESIKIFQTQLRFNTYSKGVRENIEENLQEVQQHLGWLEELKERRRMMKEYGHCGYLESEIREKTITEFSERLKYELQKEHFEEFHQIDEIIDNIANEWIEECEIEDKSR